MLDTNARTDADTPESQQVGLAPNNLEKPVHQNAGRIKSDWWSMRADLKPMSSYSQPSIQS